MNASFAGCVGEDPFGDFLIASIEHFGVDTSMIQRKGKTTKAFVSIMDDGERDFVFDRGADAEYELTGFQERYEKCEILHLGSATALLGGKMKNSYEEAINLAKINGGIISFDPNYREDLWKERKEEFVLLSIEYINKSDFVKLSDEELLMIFEKENSEDALDTLFESFKGIAAVTLGSRGTLLASSDKRVLIPSIKINPVDTTGAGDAFVGAFLSGLMIEENSRVALNDFAVLEGITARANKVAAMVCTKMGAMSSLEVIDKRK